MKISFDSIKIRPLEIVFGICVLAIAAGGGAIKNVASTSLAIMFIISLFYMKDWIVSWRSLSRMEKLVLIGFSLYTLTALMSWINASDSNEFIKQFGRYIRFTLIIPVYLVMRSQQLDIREYFKAGVVISGFLYLTLALLSVSANPDLPAGGYYHHITFGDAIMLNACLLAAMLMVFKPGTLYKVIIFISMLCAIYAALLSQARGAWLVLPVYLIVAIAYLASIRLSHAVKLLSIAAVILIGLLVTPAGDVIEIRYNEAATDVTQFISNERSNTSIGGRLAMWVVAYDVWKENPIFGTGLGDYDEDLMRYQSMGIYPEIEVHGSVHNIFIQALVGTGIVGFCAFIYGLIIAPAALFYQASKSKNQWGLLGAILIASYAIFGFSESWILRAPVISIYIAYVITITLSASTTRKAVTHDSDKVI